MRPIPRLALYVCLGLLVLAPIFSVSVPCLGDYLNHLARIDILARIANSPTLQGFYDTHWKFVPYFGMDLPVLALARVMPIYAAGRVFVGACVIMPVAAGCVLQWAVRRRVGLAPAFIFLFCYNELLERGFLAYLFSAGLAVALFAAWIAARGAPRWRRAAWFSAGVLVLYLGHAFAYLTYCILIFGYEVERAWRRNFPPRATTADWLAAAAQAVPALLLGAALGGNDNVSASSFTHYGTVLDKLGAALSPVYFPEDKLVLPVVLFLGVAAALLWRRVRIAPGLIGPILATALAAVLAPSVLFNAWGTDFRLPLVLVILIFAGIDAPAGLGRGATRALIGAVCALVAGRAWCAAGTLRALDAQVATMRHLVAVLPEGSRLLVVENTDSVRGLRVAPREMTQHMPLVAAIDRDAFIPYLFLGNTAVRTRPRWTNASSFLTAPITVAQLWDGLSRHDPPGGPPPYGWGGHVYWWGWPDKFDTVLVEHYGVPVGALPPNLHVLAASPIATLYRIGPVMPGAAGPAPDSGQGIGAAAPPKPGDRSSPHVPDPARPPPPSHA
jgi:hypothetical protein